MDDDRFWFWMLAAVDEFLPYWDAAFACGWLLATLLVIKNLRLIHRCVLPNETTVQAGLFCSLLFCAGLVLCGVLLGCAGLLSSGRQVVLLLVLTHLGVKAARPRSAEALTVCSPGFSWKMVCSPGVVAFVLLLVHSVVDGVLRMPDDFDTLWYHLPLIDSWLQSGGLYVPDCSRWYFPANSELLGVWATAACSGDFFVPLNNVPVVCLWACATAAVLQQLNVPQAMMYVGVAAVLAVYTTIHETIDASNDLMVVACFTASLAYVLKSKIGDGDRRCRAGKPVLADGFLADGFLAGDGAIRFLDCVLAGISLGLLAGVKHFALGYALGGFCLLLLSSLLEGGVRNAGRSVLTAAFAALPFGSYWYLRNWWHTGLPLYPIGASAEVGELIYPDLWSTSILGNSQPVVLQYLADAVWQKCGPLHYVSIALLPVIVVVLVVRVLSVVNALVGQDVERRACELRQVVVMIAAVVGCCLIWVVTPYCVEDEPGSLNHLKWAYTPVRYGLCFLSMAMIVGVSALPHRRLLPAILLSPWVAFQWWRLCVNHQGHVQLSLVVMLTFDLLLAGVVLAWVAGGHFRRRVLVGVFILAGWMLSVGWRSVEWHTGFGEHFQRYTGVPIIGDLLQADDAIQTWLVLDQRSYPFFGSNRKNTVIQPSGFIDVAAAAQLIRDKNVQYVVCRRRPEYTVNAYAGAYEQLDDVAELQLVESRSLLKVFRVKN